MHPKPAFVHDGSASDAGDNVVPTTPTRKIKGSGAGAPLDQGTNESSKTNAGSGGPFNITTQAAAMTGTMHDQLVGAVQGLDLSKLATVADAGIRKKNRKKKISPAKTETESMAALDGSAKSEAASRELFPSTFGRMKVETPTQGLFSDAHSVFERTDLSHQPARGIFSQPSSAFSGRGPFQQGPHAQPQLGSPFGSIKSGPFNLQPAFEPALASKAAQFRTPATGIRAVSEGARAFRKGPADGEEDREDPTAKQKLIGFMGLLLTGMYSDYTITAGNLGWKVHLAIIVMRSRGLVPEDAVRGETFAYRTWPPVVLERILEFIYSGDYNGTKQVFERREVLLYARPAELPQTKPLSPIEHAYLYHAGAMYAMDGMMETALNKLQKLQEGGDTEHGRYDYAAALNYLLEREAGIQDSRMADFLVAMSHGSLH